MSHIFFIYSSVDGHLGCFHVLAIVNRAAMNMILGSCTLAHTTSCPLYLAYPNDVRKTCLIKISVPFCFAALDTLST